MVAPRPQRRPGHSAAGRPVTASPGPPARRALPAVGFGKIDQPALPRSKPPPGLGQCVALFVQCSALLGEIAPFSRDPLPRSALSIALDESDKKRNTDEHSCAHDDN